MKLKKWRCDFCTPGCIAHGERLPECCPYEYDPDEFCWKEDTRANEPVSGEERFPEKKSPLELARMIFPDKDDEFLNFALWEKTGFPSFFNVEGAMTKEDVLLRQLIDFKATMPPAPKEKPPVCAKCGGTRRVEYYHDAGDHFGAGTAPGSGLRTRPCDCVKED